MPFTGRKFPTFFRIVKEPKNGLVKNCPLNRTVRVEFETDAANGYFERPDCPGSITFDPPNLSVSSHLWDGKFTAKFQMPYDAGVGDKVKMRVTVTDIERDTKGEPFISEFTMVGSERSRGRSSTAARNSSSRKQAQRKRKAFHSRLCVSRHPRGQTGAMGRSAVQVR